MARMGRIGAALASGLALAGVASPAFGEDSDAHRFCDMQWASDAAERSACVKRQIAGAQNIVRYLDWAKASAGPDGHHVVETFEFCRDRWSPDYHLVDACLRARALIAPPG